MNKIRSGLENGKFAYSSHSLLLAGNIVDVFIGKWQTKTETSRVMVKFPPEQTVEGGEAMCVIKLRRPLPLDEYRTVHHPEVRPLLAKLGADVEMVMLPASMTSIFPDAM